MKTNCTNRMTFFRTVYRLPVFGMETANLARKVMRRILEDGEEAWTVHSPQIEDFENIVFEEITYED